MRSMSCLLQLGAMIVAAGLMCLSPSAERNRETPQLAANYSEISNSCSNPLCTCKACDCEHCTCTPLTTFEPLVQTVGTPPDLHHMTMAEKSQQTGHQTGQLVQITPNSIKSVPVSMPAPAPEQPASPAPSPAITRVVPVDVVKIGNELRLREKAAPAGHWQTVSAGFRGRRSYQTWVADSPAQQACSGSNQACSTGGCAAPAAACSSGSCQAPQQYGSGGGGCASCGRGRR